MLFLVGSGSRQLLPQVDQGLELFSSWPSNAGPQFDLYYGNVGRGTCSNRPRPLPPISGLVYEFGLPDVPAD